jgi:hypothetical protein
VRLQAAQSLIKIGAINVLNEALDHPNKELREVAAKALAESKDMKASALVKTSEEKCKNIRLIATKAFETLNKGKTLESNSDFKPSTYQVKDTKEIISCMLKRFKEPEDYNENEYLAAAEALKYAKSFDQITVVDKIIPSMIRTVRKSPGWRSLLGSIQVLEDLGPEVITKVENSFKNRNDDTNFWAGIVFSWASAIHKKQGIPILISLLQDRDGSIRNRADLYLCCMGSRKTKKAIRTFFDPLTSENKTPTESQILTIIQSIQENSVKRLGKKELINKLLWIHSLPTDFFQAGLVPARKIGKRLYELGDGNYMQEAWKIIMNKSKTQEQMGDAQTLEGAWGGIGGWLP